VTTTRVLHWARVGTVATLVGCASLVAMVAMDGGACAAAAVRAGRADAAPTLGALVIPDLGPGYTVTAQGSPNASQFASDAPDPSAAAGALSTLGDSISTYERAWQADGGRNQVQDLLVSFADPVRAQVFLQAAQHSLETGEVVSSDPLPSIPGARRVTFFRAPHHGGVGEAIALRAGVYVDLLSIFSAAAGKALPISPADAERFAETQYAALARAPGGTTTTTPSGAPAASSKKGASAGTIGLAVVVVAIVAAAVATPGLLRRRRQAQEAAATSPPLHHAPPPASAGDAVDDLREHRG
jgi:hypothetical protein